MNLFPCEPTRNLLPFDSPQLKGFEHRLKVDRNLQKQMKAVGRILKI